MMRLLRDISPLQRMINSDGIDEAFRIVKGELSDLTVHTYDSGHSCDDWIVPKRWRAIEGFIKDKDGNTIASLDENPLFVVPYSEPVDDWFAKIEIIKHLSTRSERPEAFALEHRNAYNYQLFDWGISLPFQRWDKLPEGKYHVKIRTETEDKPMQVGEYFIQGKLPNTVCICAHIDELCNDDLSGCVVAMELMRYIESLPEKKYSYLMLLVPEMFGSLFYIGNQPEKVENIIGMLNLETVGAGQNLCLKKSFKESHPFNHILHAALDIEATLYRSQ